MEKKSITWLTADYFLDCDIDIIKTLSKQYHIYWHIILPVKNSRYSLAEIEELKNLNVFIKVYQNKYRQRNLLNIRFFSRVMKDIRGLSSDSIYLNHTPTPYFAITARRFLNSNATIVTAHQGQVHAGFSFQVIFKIAYHFFYSSFKSVNMFPGRKGRNSENYFRKVQYSLFHLH